jgi:hypothetical protein
MTCIKLDYLRAWNVPFDCLQETGFAAKRNVWISLTDHKDTVWGYSSEIFNWMSANQSLGIIGKSNAFLHRTPFDEARCWAFPDHQISAIRRSDRAKASTNPIGKIGCGVTADAEPYDHRVLSRCALGY